MPWADSQPLWQEGKEDWKMSPQNVPLWHNAYVEVKTIEKQRTQKKLYPPPMCLKAGHKFPFVEVFSSLLPNQEEETTHY